MKKWSKFLAITFMVTIKLSACQKDFTIIDTDPVEPPVTISDSIYIDRYYEFEVTATGLDTMWGYYFQYDSLKRVAAIYYNENFPTTSLNLEFKYYYNGNDTIPYKKEEFDGSTDIHPEETYFTFDAEKRIIKDSIRHYNNSGVLNLQKIIQYSYVPGKMYALTRYTENFPPSPPQDYVEYDTATLNTFGDILSHKKYSEVAGVSYLNNSSQFTYGSQAGPFSRSSVFKAHHLLPMGETFVEELMTQKNLLTQKELDENGNVGMDETFTGYQYNSYGLVKEFKRGDAAFSVVTRFFYKAL